MVTSNPDSTAINVSTLTATQAANAVARGVYSAQALMEAVLDRARQTEPQIHAYAYLDEDAAMERAEAADKRVNAGLPCGPLHGVPVGIKDLFTTSDMPTEAGSEVLKDNWSETDAVAVHQLRAAGAVLTGKHRTHEFGCGLDDPPTRTPWNLQRYPGGSTVGGGVSVAVGSSLAALGADGAGSIRKPASINGLVGLKPTWGSVSLRGIIPGVTTTDHTSWITRSVEDAALFFNVLSRGTGDPVAASADNVRLTRSIEGGVEGLRIGCPSYFFRNLEADIELRTRVCLEALAEAGAEIVEFDLPELDLASIVHSTLSAAESYPLHAYWLATCPEKYTPAVRRSMQLGALIPGVDIIAAQRIRHRLQTAMAQAFDARSLDALCSPTMALQPALLNETNAHELLPEYVRLTVPFNVTGQPAMTVPSGMSKNGMPTGFQIAGRPYDETTVFRVGRAVEATELWTETTPRLT